MKKIPSLFVRDDFGMFCEWVTPGCEWVIGGEGIATRKHDGTSVLICDDYIAPRMFKRYMLRPGRTAPSGFVFAGPPDPNTGKQPGWVPVGQGPEDARHREGLAREMARLGGHPKPGTYELCGPGIQGNPEGLEHVELIWHGREQWAAFPREFSSIRHALSCMDVEGVVWHHPDGRRAKAKKRDFGLERKP